MLKKPRASFEEVRGALGKLAQQHELLQRWYGRVLSERNQAFALRRDEYPSSSDPNQQSEERQANRRAVVTDLVGEGYDLSGSLRTMQRHKALVLTQIKQLAGHDNTLGQQQLAEAVLQHYKAGHGADADTCSTEYQAHVAVIDGLVETLETLRNRNGGRFKTADRITQEVILDAAMYKAKGQVLSAISKLLH